MKIICAGQSDTGMAFTAKYADYNFSFGKGLDTPTACSERRRSCGGSPLILALVTAARNGRYASAASALADPQYGLHAARTRQQTSISNATPGSLGAFNDL